MRMFFTDKKYQRVNRRNDRWLLRNTKDVPTVMYIKSPAVMFLEVVSNTADINHCIRGNAADYNEVLERIDRLWTETVGKE